MTVDSEGGNSPSSSNIHQRKPLFISTDGTSSSFIQSIAFLADGKHVVSGGLDKKIHCQSVEDGKEVETPMNAGGLISSIAVSEDGKWIVSGTNEGDVAVWGAESRQKVTQFKCPLTAELFAVDISPDGTRIATGGEDWYVYVWSLFNGERLLGPWEHRNYVGAVKFSPDGCLIGTATWLGCIRIYDSYDGRLLAKVRIQITALRNQSLAWARNSKQLYVMDARGVIHCVNVASEAIVFQWPIHSRSGSMSIAMAKNGKFIAASADSSVSFWDVRTHNQIGTVIKHTGDVQLMALSTNYDVVISGGRGMMRHDLRSILPSPYYDDVEKADLEGSKPLRVQEDSPNSKITCMEEIIQQFRSQLSDTQWQRVVDQQQDGSHKPAEPLLSIFATCRVICDILEEEGRIAEAVECFRRIWRESGDDKNIHDERARWETGFQQRYTERLEKLGDIAMNSKNYKEAAEHFSTVLSLDVVDRKEILIKRSKVRAFMKSWEDALSDADKAIKLDRSSYQGYERKHAALHGSMRYVEAAEAHRTMLSKLNESADESSRELSRRYVNAAPVIRRIVDQTIRYMPLILIDTETGRLYDKKQQAEAFEALPVYSELVSSMTTELDYARIWKVVKKFYRYVMFSHRWQQIEPTFQLIEKTPVYWLSASPENDKLRRFCELVRERQFRWAWSDTCCINQLDKSVQQESLVAMFRWYRGSSLTIVHLLGVLSDSQEFGCLWNSIWNTRGWTYQEYVASEVVQFYTEDWKPYLGLDLFNHKESHTVLSEMERAMNFATHKLATIGPGLNRVREKLYLASMRLTTREEDMAYSLFGIFNVALPVIYGEGNQAVGRLLEHILTGSGDATILAWAGSAGSYNSCLPADLTVYDKIVPPHIPAPIEAVEMGRLVTGLCSSLPDHTPLMSLYDRLHELPSPTLTASRLRLPGLVFRLTELVRTSDLNPVTDQHMYHTTTPAFGRIEIKTGDELSGKKDLCLVHPWIRPLLDQEFSDGVDALDATTQALRFVARLRQPFGALLFEPVSRVGYRRVAADSMIMIQFREGVSLSELIGGIRTIEVQ